MRRVCVDQVDRGLYTSVGAEYAARRMAHKSIGPVELRVVGARDCVWRDRCMCRTTRDVVQEEAWCKDIAPVPRTPSV
jgi:hypothetical protein